MFFILQNKEKEEHKTKRKKSNACNYSDQNSMSVKHNLTDFAEVKTFWTINKAKIVGAETMSIGNLFQTEMGRDYKLNLMLWRAETIENYEQLINHVDWNKQILNQIQYRRSREQF